MWKKFESLSAKKISILMATAVFLGVLFFFLPVILVSIYEVVSQGEARYSELEVIRAQKNLENEADQLDKTLKDWSAWDDTYRFAQDGNQAFIDDNLSDQALANLDIDAFIFVDLSNQVLYTKFVNRASQVEAPLPFKVETLLEAYPDLLVHPDVQSFKKGIAYLPNYPMLIASRPILNSYFEGPQQGTLILIRLLDAKRLDELSTVTLRKISLFPADALPEDLASVPTYPVLKDQVFSQARNSSIMTGYKYLADLSGQPALVLAVDNNRDLFLQGTITSIIFSAALLLLAGLLFGAAYQFSLSYQRSVQTGRKYLQRFQSIVEKSSEAILLVGSDCHILEANPVSKVLLAWPPDTQEPICLRSLLKFEPDLDVNFIEEICASGAISEHHCTRHDGAVMDVELSASTIPDAEVQAFSLILRDITARKASEKALMASEERYELAAIGANDGLWDWDLVNGGIYYSTRWKAMLGYSDDEILPVAEEWFDRIHPHDLPLFQVQLTSHLQNRTANFEYEYRMRNKSGRYRWMLARGVAVWDPAGFANRIAGSQTDIHDRRLTEERLRYDALHDSLTGLGNRLMLLDHLYTLNERKKRKPGLNFALFFMDFDRFKQVNDTLGHRAGDQVLIEAAKRLGVGLRGADIITHITSPGILARIAGDEFVILLEDFKTVDEARAIAERVNRLVSQPYHVGDKLVTLTASMGMVVPDLAYENVEDIIRDADIAMYQAKQLGGAQVVQFDQEMYNGSVARMQLETDLRKAMENGEFEVYYQPIFNLHNDRIAGFEALIRWNHPQR
ncbi:MAG: diguanylate cyclase, partial [Anaerolineaceae bacterium]|nr:diguanylate cyclase [Anaerolineaceae bacterium]